MISRSEWEEYTNLDYETCLVKADYFNDHSSQLEEGTRPFIDNENIHGVECMFTGSVKKNGMYDVLKGHIRSLIIGGRHYPFLKYYLGAESGLKTADMITVHMDTARSGLIRVPVNKERYLSEYSARVDITVADSGSEKTQKCTLHFNNALAVIFIHKGGASAASGDGGTEMVPMFDERDRTLTHKNAIIFAVLAWTREVEVKMWSVLDTSAEFPKYLGGFAKEIVGREAKTLIHTATNELADSPQAGTPPPVDEVATDLARKLLKSVGSKCHMMTLSNPGMEIDRSPVELGMHSWECSSCTCRFAMYPGRCTLCSGDVQPLLPSQRS